jgi:ElaB/YqjD/DUF883 family membrane-anchored ribosome-binding protein
MAVRSEKIETDLKAGADGQAIEAQIAQLQTDLKAIADTLASIVQTDLKQAEKTAKSEIHNLVASGKKAITGFEDELGAIENELKKTIRAKPMTAVLGAVAVGYVLAILTR